MESAILMIELSITNRGDPTMSMFHRAILRPLRPYFDALRHEMIEPGGQNAVGAVAMCLEALATIWIIDTIVSSGSLVLKLLLLGLLWFAALVNWKPPAIITAPFIHVKNRTMKLAYIVFLIPVLIIYFFFFYSPI